MEHNLWVTAKTIARDNSKSNDWVFVSDVYLHLGGNEKLIEAQVGDGVTVRLLTHFTNSEDLVLVDDEDGNPTLELYPSGTIFKAQKQFRDMPKNAVPTTFSLEKVLSQVGNTPIISLFAKNKKEIVITN